MHTRELLRRLCKLTAARELDSAPVDVITDLIDAANEALIEVWMRLPAEMRKLHVTHTLRAPQSVSVAPYHGGLFVGATLTDWEGCAIQLPDDPYPNRLLSENGLERPHNGNPANDGVDATALVWHDTIHIPQSASMFHDSVFVEQLGQHSQLVPWPHTIPMWSQMDVSPAEPCYFAIRSGNFTAPPALDPLRNQAGMTQIVAPRPGWWLHLLPRPSSAAILRFVLNVQGERITSADYRDNRVLFIPDRAGMHVTRLAEQKVKAMRIYAAGPELAKSIDVEAERSREQMRTLFQSNVELAGHYGTPRGW